MKKFLKSKRSKQLLVSALAVMVIASGFYRWASVDAPQDSVAVSGETTPVEEVDSTEDDAPVETDFFAMSRYERDCARSEAVELLAVAADYDEESVETAQKIERYAKDAEAETAIENTVKSKGYEDCVAFVDEDGVRVIVKATGLESDGVAQIKDIVVELTGVKATAIKISNRN